MALGKRANAYLQPFYRRLGTEFSDFVPRGKWLVRTPVEWLLAGFLFDPYAQESRTGHNCGYGYDANGNRSFKCLNGLIESYTYDAGDKLLSAVWEYGSPKTYTYDAAGRTASVTQNSQTTSYAYDYEDRITQITYPNSSTNTFTYNALDTRVGKVDSGGTKTYRRNGVDVTAPVLSDGVSTFTPGISLHNGGASKFLHGDRVGTFAHETDANQNTTATKQYDAFGNLTLSSGASVSPFGFAGGWGYQEDQDSGLKLLGHRYYDPSTGRFLARNPAKAGCNWYSYSNSNPSRWASPTGIYQILIPWLPPGYPPVGLPGHPECTWRMTINVGSKRVIKFVAEPPVPPTGSGPGGGGQPSASWSGVPEGHDCPHWDIDDGQKHRSHIDQWGNPVNSAPTLKIAPVEYWDGGYQGPGETIGPGFDWEVLGKSVGCAAALVLGAMCGLGFFEGVGGGVFGVHAIEEVLPEAA